MSEEDIDLITVYMSGFYDGEKKWKDKIKEKKELLLKSNELMTEKQRQTETQFQQGKLIAYEDLLSD